MLTGGAATRIICRVDPVTHYARAGDVSIAYQVLGDGPRNLVVAPGFISHVELNWEQPTVRRFLLRLSAYNRLVLFDKRGTGLSDPVPTVSTLEERAEDLLAVLDAAGMGQASILGISEGGTMTLMFAAQHPARCTSLMLYGTWARLSYAPDYPDGVDPALLARLVNLVDRWGTGVGLSAWAPSRAEDRQLRDWWGRLQRSSVSPAMARMLFASYADLDARSLLPSIQVPTLVLHRRDDVVVPIALARYVADHLPSSRLVELPGADHLFFADDIDPLLAEIELFLTGAPPAVTSNRVVASLLFADVVGSTALAAELGDRRWGELLESFVAVVTREVELHGGRVIDFAGDGVLATLPGPAAAVRCALVLHEAVSAIGLRLRAGVHTGEVEQLSNGGLGGVAVHLGARIMAQAGADEVLVSSTVRDLVVGSGIEFRDRGRHELKGIPGEWSLLQVVA